MRPSLVAVVLASAVSGQLPSYPVVYQMNLSTIIMPCNFTGPTDPSATAGWGIVDVDNSNWKGTGDSYGWAKASPMDCEERLAKQAQMTKQASPQTRVWVYRNSIIALPWYSSVRVKLVDPAYAFWFLNFTDPLPDIRQRGNANTTCDLDFDPPKCSMAFHETTHAPGYPDGDGNCAAPGCDVGSIPVGAYLFNPAAANHSVNGQVRRSRRARLGRSTPPSSLALTPPTMTSVSDRIARSHHRRGHADVAFGPTRARDYATRSARADIRRVVCRRVRVRPRWRRQPERFRVFL